MKTTSKNTDKNSEKHNKSGKAEKGSSDPHLANSPKEEDKKTTHSNRKANEPDHTGVNDDPTWNRLQGTDPDKTDPSKAV